MFDGSSPGDALVEATDYPLYVVTTAVDDEIAGCLAGFVTQSSMSPVQFIVCVSRINHTFQAFQGCESAALHLIGSDQKELASLFGEQSGDVIDKFDRVSWTRGVTGAPILAECRAWIEGMVIDRMDAGDHEAFLLTVRDGKAGTHSGQFLLSDASDFQPGHPA
jgi:flavin reductase (DIM6/NTAB) family NADH-FMN oxidoreductase RutF